jgi:carboxyl-terminal processing protease
VPPRILQTFTFVLLLALAAAALPVPPVLASAPAPAAPAAVAEPGRMVRQAFDLLMDHFVVPPSSAAVLNGGWDGALAALKEKGVEDVAGRPSLSGNRVQDWRAFAEAYGALADAASGKLDPGLLDQAVVRGMAASLNEGHTYYLTPEEFRRAQEQIRNRERYGGIGVSVNEERKIVEVFEGSPAAAGGLRPGDQIVAVDGKPIDGMSPTDASTLIRGEPGTPVELTIRREGVPEPIVLVLTRAQVRVAWVSHRVRDDGIGYLRIRSFPTPSFLGEFRNAMAELEGANIKALVIDVRGNGGGVVDTGVEIASRFIREGPLYQQVDRRGGERTVTAFGDYWDRDIPIAVLVDGSSGSMSEILAAALQENGVGRVIGTKTAGVVAAGVPHRLLDGSGLSVTVQVIKSGLGKTLNGVGLEPDQTVELDPGLLRAGRDNQLEAAVAYVRGEVAARAPRAFAPAPDARLPRAA